MSLLKFLKIQDLIKTGESVFTDAFFFLGEVTIKMKHFKKRPFMLAILATAV